MDKAMTPTQLRKNLFNTIRDVNRNSAIISINGKTDDDSAVLISKKDYSALEETVYLATNGVLQKVHERVKDDSGVTDITNGVDWDNI